MNNRSSQGAPNSVGRAPGQNGTDAGKGTGRSSGRSVLATPANIVTVTRIALVPVFVVALICPWPELFPDAQAAAAWQPWVALLFFALLSGTDAVDGHLARSRNEVSNFGKFVDPLADKILVAAALLCLVELQTLPSWVALIILAREFIISGLRMMAASEGIVIAASWYGKAKTVTQIVAVCLFIIKDSALVLSLGSAWAGAVNALAWTVMVVALVLTIVSMVDYFAKCLPALGLSDGPVSTEEAVREMVKDSDSFVVESAETQDDQVRQAAQRVVKLAEACGWQLSTAESCTGGLVAGALTAIPGSSAVVQGGVVSYSNEVKHQVLGVSQESLDSCGAVSEPVAKQMADGSRRVLGTQLAVSVTGIAGPGGAVPGKPVGTVWFGVSSSAGTHAEVRRFDGDRDEVRRQTVLHALSLFETELAKQSDSN